MIENTLGVSMLVLTCMIAASLDEGDRRERDRVGSN